MRSSYKNSGERVLWWIVIGLCLPFPSLWGQRVQGVDASYWQGNMDWSKTYDAGARFAFVRSSRGQDFTDSSFQQNMSAISNLTASGKPILAGAYHYGIPSVGLTAASTTGQIQAHARTEANHFINSAGNFMTAGWLRPVLDLEDGGGVLSRAQLSTWANSFMGHVHSQVGVEPLVYMNTNYSANMIDSSLADRDLWIANYNSGNRYGDPLTSGSPPTGNIDDWAFWQYTNQGSGPTYGVDPKFNQYIDLNVANGDMNFVRSFVIPQSVPEPSSGLLLGGLTVWIACHRRRRG